MRRIILISAMLVALTAPLGAAAQIALPGSPLPQVGGVLGRVTERVDDTLETADRNAASLLKERLRHIDRLVRRNRDAIERDANSEPARRGELLVMDADSASIQSTLEAGFDLVGREKVDELGLSIVRLRTPEGMDLAESQKALAKLLPGATVSADNLYFQSGSVGAALPMTAAASTSAAGVPVGMIDGAPGKAVPVAEVRGFARGAPIASNHGSAIASLLASQTAAPIHSADVYGTDKAGGNALAIARGLGWLVSQGCRIVTISLVGPQNPVLERAISAARTKGTVVVAAVGNDGPAAPPAYPASYEDVVAVTAVDGKRHALIEAGRAIGLDYAAPGADISGLDARGKRIKLRGTSFATPLVAARLSRAMAGGADWRETLDSEAVDLGKKGEDDTYGRGLICGSCKGP